MIVAIHQPNYLPYLGYFYKIINCDKFVFLDNVQYEKNGFQNRNKIKTPKGEAWLTLPVLTKGKFGQLIKDTQIDVAKPWSYKQNMTIQANYVRARYFKEYYYHFEQVYWESLGYLTNVNERMVRVACGCLGIKNVKFIKASDLDVLGESTERLVNICKVLGADTYYSGASGHNYMDESLFERAGIKIRYSDFKHPIYKQLWGDFIPNMSIIDLIFNEGSKSLEILKGAR